LRSNPDKGGSQRFRPTATQGFDSLHKSIKGLATSLEGECANIKASLRLGLTHHEIYHEMG